MAIDSGKMVALGIEAASDRLEVGEPGPVLDVQQRSALQIPGDHVGSTGELVVLVRLIDADGMSTTTQVGDLELAHGSVDQVGIVAD